MAEVLSCVNHPGTETRVKCSSCGDPICVKCMRQSAVGMKCPRCAQLPRSALRMGKPRHYFAGGAGGLGLAAALGAGLALTPFLGFGILFAILVGVLTGSVVQRGARGLSHRPIRILAFVVTAAGLIVGPLLVGSTISFVVSPRWLFGALLAGGMAAYRAGQ